jgi:O-methyltransferase
MFARAVITAFGEAKTRVSYVCDSFAGLPPGDRSLDNKDKHWDNTPYLEVASEIVAESFMKYGLLDDNVVFAKGFFNETMPPLSQHIKELSIMRLDGDMYESTVDVLYHLYDKLSIGGCEYS